MVSLKAHNDSVHEGIKLNCEFCNKVFSVRTELNRHKKKVHKVEASANSSYNYESDNYDDSVIMPTYI